jgi:phosphatidylinositol alpha-1,6-mannosyltransferase
MSTPSTATEFTQAQPAPLTAGEVRRLILLCPDLHEVGGIGMVSRLALRALQSYGVEHGCHGQVWSYGATASDNSIQQVPDWTLRYARGSKATAAWWGLKAGLGDARHTLVFATHLHLAPLAVPLVKRGARLAVFLHGSEAWEPLTNMRARALEHSGLVMANSRHTIHHFKRVNPDFADAAIRVCPLGVPPGQPAVPGDGPKEPYALIVSRIVSTERHKGHDLLLDLWPSIRQRFGSARLVIAGDGDDRRRLEEKCVNLGLRDSVDFLGRVDEETLGRLYSNCAFFVMPSSRLEGFGLAFLEAMRAGKACIAGEGAAEEVTEQGVTGLIVPDQNRETLLQALTLLFNDPALCARMGRAGRERYLHHFTEDHFRVRLLAALGLGPV